MAKNGTKISFVIVSPFHYGHFYIRHIVLGSLGAALKVTVWAVSVFFMFIFIYFLLYFYIYILHIFPPNKARKGGHFFFFNC